MRLFRYIIIFGILILFSCKSTEQNEELENIKKSIENFNINENIEKIIEYFNYKDIQYELLRKDDILHKEEITQFIENDDKIIFSIYYVKKSNKFIRIISETYYIVHIIFNENDELKKVIFSEAYLGL